MNHRITHSKLKSPVRRYIVKEVKEIRDLEKGQYGISKRGKRMYLIKAKTRQLGMWVYIPHTQ